ncbi:DNA starvation/stationary phase protection protein [Epidermidibacterium keratini]|uniref:DNA starvation/stationary phase protection protein n=1 Tax=Epidermidibacterium keratini TaxID=1891644 RepID=A0A7L4YIU0_9ACTN|nr:DNA starvation/stationary phase protection protein [Epidermidibacterium keratini]QHB99274.1 DNA starvation/stationary phase protection protein [Epidermidibacterium keratini]
MAEHTGFTVPGLTLKKAEKVAALLQDRLNALNDLQLTLKHAHWNVVGPNFIGVHTMLDDQIVGVRAILDEIAERIATLGVAPVGTPGALVRDRTWDDYDVLRADALEHLAALDHVYAGIIGDFRTAIERTHEIDPVSEDLLTGQTGQLEKYHWFIRAHLEDSSGSLSTRGTSTERSAAKKATKRAKSRRSSCSRAWAGTWSRRTLGR